MSWMAYEELRKRPRSLRSFFITSRYVILPVTSIARYVILSVEGIGMAKSFRVLIVDDQVRARQSLKALLTTTFQQAEVAEAANGAEAFRRAEEFNPDIVIMDVAMPEIDGLQSTRLIKAIAPGIKIIVLSLYAEYRAAALAAGADAFVSKGEPPARLLAAVARFTPAGCATHI
jgi:CheY-like chemotaxis protein